MVDLVVPVSAPGATKAAADIDSAAKAAEHLAKAEKEAAAKAAEMEKAITKAAATAKRSMESLDRQRSTAALKERVAAQGEQRRAQDRAAMAAKQAASDKAQEAAQAESARKVEIRQRKSIIQRISGRFGPLGGLVNSLGLGSVIGGGMGAVAGGIGLGASAAVIGMRALAQASERASVNIERMANFAKIGAEAFQKVKDSQFKGAAADAESVRVDRAKLVGRGTDIGLLNQLSPDAIHAAVAYKGNDSMTSVIKAAMKFPGMSGGQLTVANALETGGMNADQMSYRFAPGGDLNVKGGRMGLIRGDTVNGIAGNEANRLASSQASNMTNPSNINAGISISRVELDALAVSTKAVADAQRELLAPLEIRAKQESWLQRKWATSTSVFTGEQSARQKYNDAVDSTMAPK